MATKEGTVTSIRVQPFVIMDSYNNFTISVNKQQTYYDALFAIDIIIIIMDWGNRNNSNTTIIAIVIHTPREQVLLFVLLFQMFFERCYQCSF